MDLLMSGKSLIIFTFTIVLGVWTPSLLHASLRESGYSVSGRLLRARLRSITVSAPELRNAHEVYFNTRRT
ncbi:hypothetical protein B0H11DRAFT_1976855 [Mycena galericulata]|nr:hypothetical protein B0H11DRAFT_1976855 [Mycena galericulata]